MKNSLKKVTLLVICVGLMLFSSVNIHAQNEKKKGVQIFKMALNTKYPNPGDKFVIGIYGESNVIFVLSAISRARKIGNSVVFVKKVITPAQILDCEVVLRKTAIRKLINLW